MKNLIKTIQNTAFREGLWKRGDKIVLGVSGGAEFLKNTSKEE